jgi:hypothetical protein
VTASPAADLATPDAIIRASYAIISGRAGAPRDWERWRTFYAPGARLIPIERGPDGAIVARVLSPDEWIAARAPFFAENDFFEWETDREERRSGRMAQVWSHYDAARTPGGTPIRRGVNGVQLWHDGARWWILSITWDAIAAADAIAPPPG